MAQGTGLLSLFQCTVLRLTVVAMLCLVILLCVHQIFFLIPSNYTLLSHELSLHHTQVKLWRVEGNAKFFEESTLDNHLDAHYSKGVGYLDSNQTVSTL